MRGFFASVRVHAAMACFAWLAWALPGCGIQLFSERSTAASTQPHAAGELSLRELTSLPSTQRLQNLDTQLHPKARALLHAYGAEQTWARDAIVVLPVAGCAAAVGFAPNEQLGCALIALSEGRVAVLVMGERSACDEDSCIERSWVFLSSHSKPLPLPARRISDYRSLRAVLSSEQASALWVAGFRSYGDGRLAALDREEQRDGSQLRTEELAPRLADYATCTLAPDERELVCRSTRGDVLAIDPLHGAARLVAKLGIDVGELPMHSLRPVTWTPDGRMAVTVTAIHHRLCGAQECELVGFVDWPRREATQARLTRADALPW